MSIELLAITGKSISLITELLAITGMSIPLIIELLVITGKYWQKHFIDY